MKRTLGPWLALWIASLGAGLTVAFVVSPVYAAAAGSLMTLAISMWLMHRLIKVFDIRQMTVPGFWYLTYVVTMYIPSLLIIFGRLSPEKLDAAGYPFHIELGPHLGMLSFAINSALITVPMGVWLAGRLLRFKTGEIKEYFAGGVEETGDRRAPMLAYGLVIACAVGFSTLYVWDVSSSVGTIPLFELFKPHSHRGLAHLRIGSLVALHSPLRYVYAIVIEAVYPFLTAAAFGYFLHTRKSGWLVLFLFTFSVGTLSAAASTARGGVAAILVVTLLLLYLYLGGRAAGKFLLLSLGVIFIFPVFVTIATYRVDFWYALMVIGVRLFYTPAYIQYVYFQVVPAQVGFLHGRTSPNLAWLTGQSYFNMQEYVARVLYPHAPAHAMASGPFLGDYYVNFGMLGVLAGGVLAGFVMGWLQIWLVRRPKRVAGLAVYAFLLYAFWTLTDRPLPVVLWSGGVVFVFLTMWILGLLEAIIGLSFSRRLSVPQPHV